MAEKSSEQETDRPPLKDLAGIRYTGDSDVRIIDGFQLAAVGIKSEHDLVWTRGATVPVSHLNAAVIDFLLTQGEFALVEAEH